MSAYVVNDTVTLAEWPDTIWRVRALGERDGRTTVSLVDDDNPNHGTSFFAEVLDLYVTTHVKGNGS